MLKFVQKSSSTRSFVLDNMTHRNIWKGRTQCAHVAFVVCCAAQDRFTHVGGSCHFRLI